MHKENHHVSDRELDDLYQRVRRYDENYILEETRLKRKFLSSWFGESLKYTYTIYHYNGNEYIILENNVNKFDVIYFFKGILHTKCK